jgi:hypothetical protein
MVTLVLLWPGRNKIGSLPVIFSQARFNAPSMKTIWLVSCILFFSAQDSVPFKANTEFEVKLEFIFKHRPSPDNNSVSLDETRKEYLKKRQTGPLPYLFLNVNILTLAEGESRVRVVNNLDRTMVNKPADKARTLRLELGYTDDIKDRVAAYEYVVYLVSADKKNLSRIVILFEEDGTYFVNGEKRGKI